MLHEYTLTDNGTAGPVTHYGGKMGASAKGTWGSGTISVQQDLGNGFTEVASWTSDDESVLSVASGAKVQAVLSGATSPDLDIVFRSL